MDKSPDQIPAQMAQGFFTPSNRKLLNPAILKAVSSIRMYLRFRQFSCTGAITPSLQEAEFFYMRQSAVEYELLSLPFDKTCATLTPIQNAVRLTLLFWICNLHTIPAFFGVHTRNCEPTEGNT